MEKKIVFVHSLNNYTGSPNVLSVIIKGFLKRGYRAELITSRGEGFLSALAGVEYRYTCYQWDKSPAVTSMLLVLSQIALFLRIAFGSDKHLYYVNTIVPFGAILACRLTGKRFVIHVHENMRQHKPLYGFLRNIYRWCNKKSIFVSHYLEETAVGCRHGKVVYNSLSDEFYRTARNYLLHTTVVRTTILMVASLRGFKGVYEFVELSRRMPQYDFELVVSASAEEVEAFKAENHAPHNLTVYPLQTNLHSFYRRAKLLLQLSHPESCVETFGLTILEAMVYGIPAIVPNAGGPMELIDDHCNGYWVNPHQLSKIEAMITNLMENNLLYEEFSESAKVKSRLFTESGMLDAIERYSFSNLR